MWDIDFPTFIRQVWLPAAALTVLVCGLLALLLRFRGWLARVWASSRFFMVSFVLHLLLVMILAVWSLPTVVDIIVSQLQEAEPAGQPFDDNQHQSHEEGKQAWEKLADLTAADTTVDLVRRELQPLNIADSPERLKPTISLEQARRLSSDQVLYVPADRPVEIRSAAALSPRTMAPAGAVVELAEEADQIVPRAAEPPPSNPAEAEERAELARRPPQPPPIRLPAADEIAGPSRPNRALAVGLASEMPVDVPPAAAPMASRLDRPRAKAPAVVFAEDSVGMQEMFTLREGDIRKQYIELFGGTPDSELAVDRGLEWLIAHQNGDGSWSLHRFHENCKGKHANCSGAGNVASNTAATGLVLLPLLAAGHTHQAGAYQQQVGQAVQWLISQQKENGDLLSAGDQQRMYSHSIATIALCEAYGMSGDPQLEPVARKALDFIVAAQHAATGGWRYEPNQPGDTSVVGWAMMALKSGEMAGIIAPPATLESVGRWLKSVEGNQPVGGVFGYQNASVSPAMTAEGLLCLQFMGSTDRNSPRMRAGADYLLQNLPQPNQAGTSYYWYYGTQVMYHMQGHYWEAWNERLRDLLVQSQIKEGPLAGTWDVKDQWEQRGGRVYATALKLLMLEVYYRHLPLYQQLEP